MTDDVFNQEPPVKTPEQIAAEAAPQEPQNAFADKLDAIQNEDGTPKYAGVADALDSIPHAQSHIKTVEGENAELKEKLAKSEAAKELLEKAGNAKPATEGLTAEEVAAVTRQTIADDSETSRKADNVASVNAKFSELYGEKASAQMGELAKASGMTVAAIKELAEKSPLAVYRLAGINSQSAPAPRTPADGQRGDNFQPPDPVVETPKPVMSGATSAQMVDNWRQAGEIIKQ